MLWVYFLFYFLFFFQEVLDILVRYMVSWILANTNSSKKQYLMASARKLIMGHGWTFHQDKDPKQTSKINRKMCQ